MTPDMAGDSPTVLPFVAAGQITPSDTFVSHLNINGGWGTTITRLWDEKAHRTCGVLCISECTFHNGACQKGFLGYIPKESCPLFAET